MTYRNMSEGIKDMMVVEDVVCCYKITLCLDYR
jgi:hypothetical protein